MTASTASALTPDLPSRFRGPRAEILLSLKRESSATIRDLTEHLSLSLNAVRHHLRELESEGLIEYGLEHKGVGAPARSYHLTPRGQALFPRRYLETLTGVLAKVEEHAGRAAAIGMLEAHFDELASRLASQVEGRSDEQRMEIVTRALAEEGYMPEWQGAGQWSVTLREHNCAIQAVAERYPEICAAEQRFLEKVLGAAVNRKAHMLSGCSVCEYHVQFEADRESAPVVQIGSRHARPGELA
jgi:DeoR family transcriptional regulator, suf operon transcriptional repressor